MVLPECPDGNEASRSLTSCQANGGAGAPDDHLAGGDDHAGHGQGHGRGGGDDHPLPDPPEEHTEHDGRRMSMVTEPRLVTNRATASIAGLR